jgi:hypothetical protein
MSLTAIRYFLLPLACFCATAVAQPLAAEALFCGSAERAAFAPVAGRSIAELRGFLFAKKQLDQLLKYLESKEGGAKWNDATQASQLSLMQAAARSATTSSAAVTHLPFLPSARLAFESQFAFECSKAAQLIEQMRAPGFARYLEVRARVAAAAPAWYASGLFAKLSHGAAPALLQPPAAPVADVPAATRPARVARPQASALRQKGATVKPAAKATATERQMALAKRQADVDLVLSEIGLFNVGMTAIESELLRAGALANAPAALIGEALEALAEPGLKSLFLDPAYLGFKHALMSAAHKTEPLLIQDYPHLEPLGRDVSPTLAADLLRPAPVRMPPEPKPDSPAPVAPVPPPKPAAAKP